MQNPPSLNQPSLSPQSAAILMIALTVARGSSFLLSKQLLGTIEPLNLLGIRFLLAFFILFFAFFRRTCQTIATDRAVLRSAFLLGTINFLVMTAELYGLKYTDTSTCSFLEHTAIVLVPLAECVLLRRFPAPVILFSAALTLTGIGFLAFHGSGITAGPGIGEMLCILVAILYTAAIIMTDRLSKKHDSFVLGILYVGVMGMMGILVSFFAESPHLPQTGTEYLLILALALVCTCFGFTMQPVAQKHLTSETSGMICAVNPLTAAILGWLILNEQPGIPGVLGGLMILTGILLPHLQTRFTIRQPKPAVPVSETLPDQSKV